VIESAIVAALLADPAVVALVADRVYETEVPERGMSDTRPAVVVADRVSATNPVSQDGAGAAGVYRIQVDAWARSRAKAHEVAASVRAALNGKAGIFAGEALQMIAQAPGSERSFRDREVGLHRTTADYMVHAAEAA